MERNIVGVWRLASTRATDADGKPAGVPFGPRGMGLVTFTSDGRMMSVLVDGRASLPEGTPGNIRPTAATTPSTAAFSRPWSTPTAIPRASRHPRSARCASRASAWC
jgi:hypothetical protein